MKLRVSLNQVVRRCAALVLGAGLSAPLFAQVPRMLDYQGRIAAQGVNFEGSGLFKFALVNQDGTTFYWSHDGTGTPASPPASSISLPVSKGFYNTRLGDTGIPNMSALTPAVLGHPDVRLRVWFNDGTSGFQLLSPDRRIAAVAYAVMAESVPDGSITDAKLAPGSVTLDKLNLPNALLASYTPNDPALAALGYSAVQTFPAKSWVSGPAGAPNPRSRHSAVWNGSSLLIWGGEVAGALSNQGGSLEAANALWTPLPVNTNSPARADHTAVWTGDRMVVWGGATASGMSGTGAVYHPDSQSWVATSLTGAPTARTAHTAVWTGNRMLVWGGRDGTGTLRTGASYAPPTGAFEHTNAGTWEGLSLPGAPSIRRDHTAVWTGSRMIVWGGQNNSGTPLSGGGIYNPGTNMWSALTTIGAPTARLGHSAVWTGTKMIIYGGSNSSILSTGAMLNDGGIYDPATATWSALPAAGATDAQAFHQAVWTGSEMIIFGGLTGNGSVSTAVVAYKPATNTWRSLPSLPSTTSQPTGVWSGTSLLAFGGFGMMSLDPTPPLTLYGKF